VSNGPVGTARRTTIGTPIALRARDVGPGQRRRPRPGLAQPGPGPRRLGVFRRQERDRVRATEGALGSIGGEVASAPVCPAFGGSAQSGATLYVPCTNGLAQVQVSASGSIRVGWQTGSGANGPPVVGGGAVWSIDLARGELVALAPSTGQPLAQLAVGPVPHFASPTLWNGQVFVGTDSGVTAIDAR